jgi:hypothetical protein
MGKHGQGGCDSEQGQVVGTYQYGNEHSGPINAANLLTSSRAVSLCGRNLLHGIW